MSFKWFALALFVFTACGGNREPLYMTSKVGTFLGDSITDGIGDPALNGYRLETNARVKVARPDIAITWVGGITSGDAPTNNHEGAVGATTSTFIGTINVLFGAGNPYNPDFVTVLIGTNDCATALGGTNFPANYTTMMGLLHTQLPSAGFVVSHITPSPDPAQQARIDAANATLPGLWATMIASGYIIEIATPEMVQPIQFTNGVHPNPSGYSTGLVTAFVSALLRLLNRI
jgi:lysophospholipase L1-like esterase